MTSAMVMMERATATGNGLPSISSTPSPGAPAANWMMVPRCDIKIEKCTGGLKLKCSTEDDVACGALQSLCKMLAGGACSCCCTWNGMTVAQCNFCCGNCKCETTKDGVCITCTSGDPGCQSMLQACCECLAHCLKAGCCCYVCFNNTPVCCATC